MVIFHRETIEKELSPEELEKEKLRAIEHSDAWKTHAALHKKAGLGDAQLHISGEPLFGEQDAVRARMGLPQKGKQESMPIIKTESLSYGPQHTGEHSTYTAPGSQPGLWASCNCGAEFKAEEKSGKLQVTTYGVVGSDTKATGYVVNSSSTAKYTQEQSATSYTSTASSATSYQ